jgi:hypothetical protein
MTRAQQYISSILERFPASHLPTDDDRTKFEQLRIKVANAPDLYEELKALHRVRGFDEVALSLLWIAERVERDPSKLESNPEEEALVESRLKAAFGVEAEPPIAAAPAEPESPFFSPDADRELATVSPPVSSSSDGGEAEFSALVERFVEAMQGGDDTREGLMEQVLQQCERYRGEGNAEMLQRFCQYLAEFLTYVRENQFMDDVRVMNILSNITTPLAQWAAASESERTGLLDEGVATLMDFKSLFE